jgi:hypothetical protein
MINDPTDPVLPARLDTPDPHTLVVTLHNDTPDPALCRRIALTGLAPDDLRHTGPAWTLAPGDDQTAVLAARSPVELLAGAVMAVRLTGLPPATAPIRRVGLVVEGTHRGGTFRQRTVHPLAGTGPKITGFWVDKQPPGPDGRRKPFTLGWHVEVAPQTGTPSPPELSLTIGGTPVVINNDKRSSTATSTGFDEFYRVDEEAYCLGGVEKFLKHFTQSAAALLTLTSAGGTDRSVTLVVVPTGDIDAGALTVTGTTTVLTTHTIQKTLSTQTGSPTPLFTADTDGFLDVAVTTNATTGQNYVVVGLASPHRTPTGDPEPNTQFRLDAAPGVYEHMLLPVTCGAPVAAGLTGKGSATFTFFPLGHTALGSGTTGS